MPSVPKKPLALRVDEDLLARVDAAAERLGQTRTKFVERALESALRDGGENSVGHRDSPGSSLPASIRAPQSKETLSREEYEHAVARDPFWSVSGETPAPSRASVETLSPRERQQAARRSARADAVLSSAQAKRGARPIPKAGK